MHSSCALLGGFAIGARVLLLWQHSADRDTSGLNLLSLIICHINAIFITRRGKGAMSHWIVARAVSGMLPHIAACCGENNEHSSAFSPCAITTVPCIRGVNEALESSVYHAVKSLPVKFSLLMSRSWFSASRCDRLASSWSRTCCSSYDWHSSASMLLFSAAITCATLHQQRLRTDIRQSDVTVICSHNTISMLWDNTAYCVKLSGGDVSRYSNKTESVGLRKCQYHHYITKKVMPQEQTFLRTCLASWRENSWHRYGMKKLRLICNDQVVYTATAVDVGSRRNFISALGLHRESHK